VPVPGGGHPGPVGWFVWLDGTLTQIDVAPYQVREVVDIDAHGRALVNASDATGRSRALLWDGVGYVDLGSLTPDGNTWAADMNNRGQVVGASATASGDHAFLWQDGQMTDLHTLGDGYSHAIAVSSRGHVAGALTPMAGRGFLWWCGVMIDLMTPGVYVNQPIDVNAHGQVISAIDSLSGSRVVLSTPTGR
jgi:probable HAF family extracellular repeat protein